MKYLVFVMLLGFTSCKSDETLIKEAMTEIKRYCLAINTKGTPNIKANKSNIRYSCGDGWTYEVDVSDLPIFFVP
jgi:hypothetical protein